MAAVRGLPLLRDVHERTPFRKVRSEASVQAHTAGSKAPKKRAGGFRRRAPSMGNVVDQGAVAWSSKRTMRATAGFPWQST
jgi:hypothetical protein